MFLFVYLSIYMSVYLFIYLYPAVSPRYPHCSQILLSFWIFSPTSEARALALRALADSSVAGQLLGPWEKPNFRWSQSSYTVNHDF